MCAPARPEVRDGMVGLSGRESAVMRVEVVCGKADMERRCLLDVTEMD